MNTTFPSLPWAPFRDTNTYDSAKAKAVAAAKAKPKRPPMYPELQGLENRDKIEDARNGKRYTVRHTDTGKYLLQCQDDIRIDTDKHGNPMLVGTVQSVELKPETVAIRIRQGRYLVTHYEAVTKVATDPMEGRNQAVASALLAKYGKIAYSLGTVHLARLTADSTLYDIHTLIHPLGTIGKVEHDGTVYELIESPAQRKAFINRKRRAIASVAPFLRSRVYAEPEPEDTERAVAIARKCGRLAMPDHDTRQVRKPKPVLIGPDNPEARNLPFPDKPLAICLSVYKPQGTFGK